MELSLRWARRSRDEFQRLQEPERAVRHRAGRHVREPARRVSPRRWSRWTCRATPSAGQRRRARSRRCCASWRTRRTGLPAAKPRYLMGVGTPEDLVEGVARHRHVRLRDAHAQRAQRPPVHALRRPADPQRATKSDERPLDPSCGCTACRGFSRLSAPPGPLRRNAGPDAGQHPQPALPSRWCAPAYWPSSRTSHGSAACNWPCKVCGGLSTTTPLPARPKPQGVRLLHRQAGVQPAHMGASSISACGRRPRRVCRPPLPDHVHALGEAAERVAHRGRDPRVVGMAFVAGVDEHQPAPRRRRQLACAATRNRPPAAPRRRARHRTAPAAPGGRWVQLEQPQLVLRAQRGLQQLRRAG